MLNTAENHYRLVVGICAFTAVALTPFTLHHVARQEWLMAAATGVLNLVLAAAAVWLFIYRDNAALIRRAGYALLLLANITVVINVYAKGGPTIFWVYPLIFANFYLLSLVPGFIASVLFSGICLWLAAPSLTGEYLARAITAIPLCILFGVVFSYALGRQRRQLQYFATHDALTGLGNRRSLKRGLADAVARRRRYGERCSLIIFDIDRFKSINDTMGHMHADSVIAELARMMLDRVRAVDRLYRFGGEEFVMLLPHAGAQPCWQLAEALRMEVEEHEFGEGTRITVSAGVAELGDGENADCWLTRADNALLEAKRAGRNRVCLASEPEDDPGKKGPKGPVESAPIRPAEPDPLTSRRYRISS